MKTSKMPSFGPIGLAVAHDFDEIDNARTSFETERDAILLALKKGLEQTGQIKGKEAHGPDNDGWVFCDRSGLFTKARKADGRNSESGFSFGFDSWHDPFAFQTCIWFKVSENTLRKMDVPIESSALRRLLAPDVDALHTFHEDGHVYLRAHYIPSRLKSGDAPNPGFQSEAFEEAVQALPKLFTTADERLTEHYRRAAPKDE